MKALFLTIFFLLILNFNFFAQSTRGYSVSAKIFTSKALSNDSGNYHYSGYGNTTICQNKNVYLVFDDEGKEISGDSIVWRSKIYGPKSLKKTDTLLINYSDSYTLEYYSANYNTYRSQNFNFSVFKNKLKFIDTFEVPNCAKPFVLKPIINNDSIQFPQIYWTSSNNFSVNSLSSRVILNPTINSHYGTDIYSLLLKGTYGCDTTLKIVVNNKYNHPSDYKVSICKVTFNSNTNKNEIVWNKDISDSRIKHYRIYKQSNLTSLYEKIHDQPYSSENTFIDSNSSPYQFSSSYKISMIDSCGFESELSNNHTTILLSSSLGINNTVNLAWNAYEGMLYNNFEIWRSFDGVNYSKLGQVSNNSFQYIDVNPPSIGYYQIRIASNNCSLNRSNGYIISNIVDKDGKGLTSSLLNLEEESIKIYPNPAENILKIEVDNFETSKTIVIKNMIGMEVANHTLLKKDIEIDISQLNKGMYFIEIDSKKMSFIKAQ